MKVSAGRPFRILDFDCENRPLSYWYDGKPTAEMTAIASCWVGDLGSMEVNLLQRNGKGKRKMLWSFVQRYDEADMVTGHFITRHDLPMINVELLENGYPPLKPKLVCDTKTQYIRHGDIPATQEHLADMFGVGKPKYHMKQSMWRDANRLTESGLKQTYERVVEDVIQHMELREAMLKAGALRAPKVWRP